VPSTRACVCVGAARASRSAGVRRSHLDADGDGGRSVGGRSPARSTLPAAQTFIPTPDDRGARNRSSSWLARVTLGAPPSAGRVALPRTLHPTTRVPSLHRRRRRRQRRFRCHRPNRWSSGGVGGLPSVLSRRAELSHNLAHHIPPGEQNPPRATGVRRVTPGRRGKR
jgi:hypothetical protein